MRRLNELLATATIGICSLFALSSPALAVEANKQDDDHLQIKPIIDARSRYETVDQGPLEADALTLRLRAGAEAKLGNFSILAEGEGTAAAVNDYNAFPFAIVDSQRRPEFATISDPRNIELNRLQVQYKSKALTVTAGRQRINLDDQRWVGSVGWRQNEQTFDAIRGEAAMGSVTLDATYAISQRTIFGEDAAPRTSIDGNFIFTGLGSKLGPIQGKLFAYLVDYDEAFALPNSSQTYGGYVTGAVPLGKTTKITLRASYAHQSDYGRNPYDYAADYWSFEAGTNLAGFNINGGWEQLGSDDGRAVQTPMATLHKFNGWADIFLTAPPNGLEDGFVYVGRTFEGVKSLPGLNANIAFHQFDSARSNIEYGTEWDASAGFKLGKVSLLLKYADYKAKAYGVDTRKLWLQAEYAF